MKYSLLIFCLFLFSCNTNTINYSQNYVTTLNDMKRIDVGKGEVVYQMEGKNHEMKDMSFVITETQPGGGPPLHIHPTEEAHVVLSGKVKYIVGDSVFTVEAPYVVKIPPNTKHTFMNVGDTVLNLIGVFGHDNFGPYK
ncbi:MAG: cupin domain-containing protein, partial [Chitinophagales bacterium]|nr:cupin domain-containing protein [Chitinophagales bacterium]